MGFGGLLKKALLNPLKIGARVAAAPVKMAHATNKRLIKGDIKGSLGAGLGTLKKGAGQSIQDFAGMSPIQSGVAKFLAAKGGQLAGAPQSASPMVPNAGGVDLAALAQGAPVQPSPEMLRPEDELMGGMRF